MKIRTRLLAAFLTLFIAAFVLAGIASYRSIHETLTAQTLAHLESVATIKRSRIHDALAQRLERLALISSRTQMRLSLFRFSETGDTEHQQIITRIIQDAKRSINDFRLVRIYLPDGRLVASTDGLIGSTASNMLGEALFKRSKMGPSIKTVALSKEGALISTLTGPLKLDGKLIGILHIEADAADLLEITGNYTGLGDTGETLLAKRDTQGDALFISPLRFDVESILSRRIDAERTEVPIIQALNRNDLTLTSATSYRGNDVLAVTRYVRGVDWGLAVIIESSEAYAPLHQLRNWLILLLAVTAVLVTLAAALLSRTLTRPISSLAQTAQLIGEGQSDLHMNTKEHTGGYLELQSLARTIDQLTQNLLDKNRSLEATLNELHKTVEERTQTLQELRSTQEALVDSQRLAAIGDTVSGIAHEVNTPLGILVTAASSFTQATERLQSALADGSMKKSDLNGYIEKAVEISKLFENNAQRASDLMRSYKTVTIDQASEAFRDFELRSYVNDILVNLKPTTKKRPHSIQVTGLESLTIYSIPGAIAQIITNLVENSYKHGLSDDRPGEIVIDLAKNSIQGDSANQVVITYSDNGKGIPKDQQQQVFDQFFTTARDSGGSGVGMHVVYKLIVEKLGGTIDLESEEGHGVTFRITLPISSDNQT